jgi:hypothetical protein
MEQLLKELSPFLSLIIPALLFWNSVIAGKQQQETQERKAITESFLKQAEQIEKLVSLAKIETAAREAAELERDTVTADLNRRITENSQQLTKVELALEQAETLTKAVA